jgi:O-antigen/teichoic acid export membrane protein
VCEEFRQVKAALDQFRGRLGQRLQGLLGTDTVSFFGHSRNYLVADFANSGLALLAVPIMTRLLVPNEYGIVAVYTSVVALLACVMRAGIPSATVRFYHDRPDELRPFLGVTMVILVALAGAILGVLAVFLPGVSRWLAVEPRVVAIAGAAAAAGVFVRMYASYLQASQQSRRYAVLAFLQHSLVFCLSIVLVMGMSNQWYFGRIYAYAGVAAAVGAYCAWQLIGMAKVGPALGRHATYALAFGLPLTGHTMSALVLKQFDRVIINQVKGSTEAALYTLAYQVGLLMQVVVMGMNKAWVPVFYSKLNAGDAVGVERLASRYARIVALAACGLMLYSAQIFALMADRAYRGALAIVPLVVASYVLLFLYTVYANYLFYGRKTGRIAANTVAAGATNVALNYWLVPKFGYAVAAFTTLGCYSLLFVLHYAAALSTRGPVRLIRLGPLVRPLSLVGLALVVAYGLQGSPFGWGTQLAVSTATFGVVCWVLFGRWSLRAVRRSV